MAAAKIPFFTRFSPPPSRAFENHHPSRTFQHFKTECDINSIVSRYSLGSITPYEDRKDKLVYGDFTDERLRDFRLAQETVLLAQQQFDELPSDVRRRFDNNPALLLEFVHDSSNYDEAVKLGLITPPPAAEKPPAETANSD